MRALVTWTDHVPDHDGIKSVCHSLAYRPDGTQLIAAAGSRVLVYDAADGDLLHSLKGHKDAVCCVAYSQDGKRFASGGADKTIIIWTHKAEGILKYNHSDSIQCLSYNPVTQQLASGTASDFGIWSPEQKSVTKHRVASKVLCCAWTGDGQRIALGLYSGQISICDRNGVEQRCVSRTAPVWSLQWNAKDDKSLGCLAVGCWDGTLSIYDISGKQIGKDKALGFDPCCVSYHDGSYLCIGGSDKKIVLHSKMGVYLTTVCETGDWVWAVCSRPNHDFIAVGCNDGSISMLQLIFSRVHGLYQEHYAFRDAMTDIVIQHLLTNDKVRIKCWDYIKKIAIYEDCVAVQLSNQIIVYELTNDPSSALRYRQRAKIRDAPDCNLLVLTAKHVTLCQETKLQLLSLEGIKVREWLLESTIKYIKVCGGPSGREGLLVGTKNGLVVKIWIHNNFPIHIYKHTRGIRCLDLSPRHTLLAVVDESATLLVHNLQTKETTFEDKSVSSLAWNTETPSVLCYSGNGKLNIKAGDMPVQRQKLQGCVVGFQGSKVFCIHHLTMQTIDVPLSTSMRHYIIRGQFSNAYSIACLGVTEADWRELAIESLQGNELEVARSCFVRIQDVCYLDLIDYLQQDHSSSSGKPCLRALVLAYQGRFDEAAQAYVEAGQVDRAMEMLSDLRLFDKARALAEDSELISEVVGKTSVKEIIQRQAQWTEETQDHETAADMYITAGQLEKALAILEQHGPTSKLIEVARRLKSSQLQELSLCASLMRGGGHFGHALETYQKMGDFRAILFLHMELEQWDDAFAMEGLHPELKGMVLLPYAEWLTRNDRFEDARRAYQQSGRPDLSRRLLTGIIENEVRCGKFKAAAYASWLLAVEFAQRFSKVHDDAQEEQQTLRGRCLECMQLAEIYYAYAHVHQCRADPYCTPSPGLYFNVSKYLLSRLPTQPRTQPLEGVSAANILLTLAKHAEKLGRHHTANLAYKRLQGLKIHPSWVEVVEVEAMIAQARAGNRQDGQVELEGDFCFCCSSQIPSSSLSREDSCNICFQPFFRSFLTFKQLPMVEFNLDEGISHEEARDILLGDEAKFDPNNYFNLLGGGSNGPSVTIENVPALFKEGVTRASRETLTSLPKDQILIAASALDIFPPRYFIVVNRAVDISQCATCKHFFEQEEWDLFHLVEGTCPFCKGSGVANLKSTDVPIFTPRSKGITQRLRTADVAGKTPRGSL